MKYHLGCGGNYLDGYCNVDQYTSRRVDLDENILTMTYKKCDEIRSHHVFEHFSYVNSLALMIKWSMALENNGLLIIDVPDPVRIMAACNGSLRKQRACMRLLFGSHEGEWAYHINGWTQAMMQDTLNKFGIKLINVRNYGSPEHEFPHMGTEYTGQKYRESQKNYLINQAKIMLLDYTHPNEVQLYNMFVEQLIKAVQ